MKLFLLLFACFLAFSQAAILGIDFGHKYTKSVLLAQGIPFDILLTGEGKRKDLSGLCIRPQNGDDIERVFGSNMGSLTTRFPGNCVVDLKMLIGRSIDDPQCEKFIERYPALKLVPDMSRNNSVKVDFELGNQSYIFSVEELLAMQLNIVKQRAAMALKQSDSVVSIAEDVAISVPPFANWETRQGYLDAIHLANFSSFVGLIDEGTAVASNFLVNRIIGEADEGKEYHLIFDMGSGSTVATLFSVTPFKNKTIELDMLNVGYDEFLGGDVFTDSVDSIIKKKLLESFNIDLSELTTKISARIRETAEKATTILSANSEYQISLESIYDDQDFRAKVTREEFEKVNEDIIFRITKPVLDALSGFQINNLKSVILNGGSTRVPFVQKHLAALVGDDKISKTVNTDESCALGTTLRAYTLKTGNSNVDLKDRIYHNYELSINGDPKIGLFEKGSLAGTNKRLRLGQLKDEYIVDLYEDGELLHSYKFENVLKKANKLRCESIDFFLLFNLDYNKMPRLLASEVICSKDSKKTEKKGIFKNLLKDKKVSDDDSSTGTDQSATDTLDTETALNNTNSTRKHYFSHGVPIYVSNPDPHFARVNPISNDGKRLSLDKLSYLNLKDSLKAELDHEKNVLESKCYDLRTFIDNNEKAMEKEGIETSKYTSFVNDVIEWLDFESDDSSIQDVKNKITKVRSMQKELNDFLEMSWTDLSFDNLKKLYSEGTSKLMKVQSFFMDAGDEISNLRKRYEEEGFNFDKLHDKLKLESLKNSKLLEIDSTISKVRKTFDDFAKFTEKPKKLESLSRQKIFGYFTALSNGLKSIEEGFEALEKSHRERLTSLQTKFESMLKKKIREAERKKSREERKAAQRAEKEASERENSDITATFIEEDADDSSETVGTSSSNLHETSSSFEHDEL
ncbi:uncharacterized protein PRCAT00001240001 [Priceomyces carsonii]|uniref:uncharacterized protein n=1 Tax=Priceomyces carsonii TaxID=28549 RepID=UPI002ED8CA90|nr:unnamed protein product [Priceomyces carsonii]